MNSDNEKTLRKSNGRDQCKHCCHKLASFDWQVDLLNPQDEYIPQIVELRFKNTRKLFCRNPHKLRLKVGDRVVIECPTGYDIGIVSLITRLVDRQMKKKEFAISNKDTLLPIVRYASERDLAIWEEAKALEYDTLVKARKYAMELKLQMKINDVEYQADKKKATFFYTADNRVDFRELIKTYAKNFHVKIEMRQIGIRQEAGRVGGIGDCGRELCCSKWLSEFTTVPTIAAKQQNLYINPSKLSGQCGRLKCCLNYELDVYLEAMEEFPPEDIVIRSKKSDAYVFKIDLLKGIMWFNVSREGIPNPFPIHVKNVKKILEMNKNGKKPENFDEFIERSIPAAIISDYED